MTERTAEQIAAELEEYWADEKLYGYAKGAFTQALTSYADQQTAALRERLTVATDLLQEARGWPEEDEFGDQMADDFGTPKYRAFRRRLREFVVAERGEEKAGG